MSRKRIEAGNKVWRREVKRLKEKMGKRYESIRKMRMRKRRERLARREEQ